MSERYEKRRELHRKMQALATEVERVMPDETEVVATMEHACDLLDMAANDLFDDEDDDFADNDDDDYDLGDDELESDP